MTRARRVCGVCALAVAAFALYLCCCYLFFPVTVVNECIASVLAVRGLSLSGAADKTLHPGLEWLRPALSCSQGELVRFDRVEASPRLWPLFAGRGVVGVDAGLGAGHLGLEYGVSGPDALSLDIAALPLSRVPFFKTMLGADLGGTLRGEGKLLRQASGISGAVKFEVKQLAFSGVKLGAFALPNVSELNCQGMLRLTSGRARLESITLQGNGVYMRLSGDLPVGDRSSGEPLNLTLEIMPKPEFLAKQQMVFLLLAKFAASPGIYKVPIRGSLLKPAIL